MLAIRRMIHPFSVTILNIFQGYFETTRVTLFSGFISWCVNFFQKRQAIASLKEFFYLMGQNVLAVE